MWAAVCERDGHALRCAGAIFVLHVPQQEPVQAKPRRFASINRVEHVSIRSLRSANPPLTCHALWIVCCVVQAVYHTTIGGTSTTAIHGCTGYCCRRPSRRHELGQRRAREQWLTILHWLVMALRQ
jgi:hypothetical protein